MEKPASFLPVPYPSFLCPFLHPVVPPKAHGAIETHRSDKAPKEKVLHVTPFHLPAREARGAAQGIV